MRIIVGVAFVIATVSAKVGDGGSKCPDASCTPAPPGQTCEPRYGERDECCPVWYCPNGQQVYGKHIIKYQTDLYLLDSF